MKITKHGRLKTFLDRYTNVDIAKARTVGDGLDEFLKREREKDDSEYSM